MIIKASTLKKEEEEKKSKVTSTQKNFLFHPFNQKCAKYHIYLEKAVGFKIKKKFLFLLLQASFLSYSHILSWIQFVCIKERKKMKKKKQAEDKIYFDFLIDSKQQQQKHQQKPINSDF